LVVVVMLVVVAAARLAILMLALFRVVVMASQETLPVETVEEPEEERAETPATRA
jgi:hypothetical protein